MDGDGSIQVNHWRKKSLQYRLIIKLKFCPENVSMLNLISENIGGQVRVLKDNSFVIWVVNSRESVWKILQIFIIYPPLTSRLRAQVKFMLDCLNHNNVERYLNLRKNKYIIRETVAVEIVDSYFNEWLSGFVEAEGCFSFRKNGYHSFSIGQNDDKNLIEAIKLKFNIQSEVRNPYKQFWCIETYRILTLHNIIKHFNKYPLLGEKLVSLNKVKVHMK